MGWASHRAYVLAFIVLRINFLILVLLELRRKLIFLFSFVCIGLSIKLVRCFLF
ncbi:hypothetical protein RchiOBHm_Chr2g0141001 [Rosa chinensis]|uniref:Uncharacterized protein n=1 Tax=Rosa chinensis TaxID=74649 RepID=A0A2P6RXK5_ROSCH|nr:hypothetical protein RchiOBHm_Chr2g0141001 [Rosa chinensis]